MRSTSQCRWVRHKGLGLARMVPWPRGWSSSLQSYLHPAGALGQMSLCLLTWHEGGKGCNTHSSQCETEERAAFCSHPALLKSPFSAGEDISSSSSSCSSCTTSSVCCSAGVRQHICVAITVNIQQAQGDKAIGNGCTACPTAHPQPAAPVNKVHSGQNQNNKLRSATNLSRQLRQLLVFPFAVACSQICHPEHGNRARGGTLGTWAQISQGLFPLGGSSG